MTADEIYAQLERALAELSDDHTPPTVAAEAVRTYALAAIALRDRESAFPRCVSSTGGHRWDLPVDEGIQLCRSCGIVRPVIKPPLGVAAEFFHLDALRPAPVVHESTEPAVPSSIPPDDFEPDEKPLDIWAGLETHGKGGPIGG